MFSAALRILATFLLGHIYGMELSKGPDHTVNSGSTFFLSTTTLSETTALVCYRDEGNAEHGTCNALSLVGMSLTHSANLVVSGGGASLFSTVALNSTTALVCYRDEGNSDAGTCTIVFSSGSSLSKGADFVFNSGATFEISTAALSSTMAMICYTKAYHFATCNVLYLTAGSMHLGPDLVVNVGYTEEISAAVFSESAAIACWREFRWSGSKCTPLTIDIEHVSLVKGADFVVTSGRAQFTTPVALSSSMAVQCYEEVVNSEHYGICNALRLDGVQLTKGEDFVVSSVSRAVLPHVAQIGDHISTSAMSTNMAVVCYKGGPGALQYGTCNTLELYGASGTSIVKGPDLAMTGEDLDGEIMSISTTSLSANVALVCYRGDARNSGRCTCNVLVAGDYVPGGPVGALSASTRAPLPLHVLAAVALASLSAVLSAFL